MGYLIIILQRRTLRWGVAWGLVCMAHAGDKAPRWSLLAMTNAAMEMVPSQTVDGSVALGDNSVGLWSFSSQRG